MAIPTSECTAPKWVRTKRGKRCASRCGKLWRFRKHSECGGNPPKGSRGTTPEGVAEDSLLLGGTSASSFSLSGLQPLKELAAFDAPKRGRKER